jgi:hypothetical protein
MAPEPPIARGAPAQPWRPSITPVILAGPDLALRLVRVLAV